MEWDSLLLKEELLDDDSMFAVLGNEMLANPEMISSVLPQYSVFDEGSNKPYSEPLQYEVNSSEHSEVHSDHRGERSEQHSSEHSDEQLPVQASAQRVQQEASAHSVQPDELVDLVDVARGKLVIKSLPGKRVEVVRLKRARETKDKAFLFSNELLQGKLPILNIAATILRMASGSIGDTCKTKYTDPAVKRQRKLIAKAIARFKRQQELKKIKARAE